MVVRKTSKVHHEVDLAEAAEVFIAAGAAKELCGEQITSLWDLYSVETLREQHHLRIGQAIPTDVIVFGKGEPEEPSCTKVGGRPYWPVGREWPMLHDGSPSYFLAQFNFSDSMDILDLELPGDVLLVLTDSEIDWIYDDDAITFQWVSNTITPDLELDVPSTIVSAGPFYGAIHRTADYPEANDLAYESEVSQSYNLPILNGTKIGGLPHFIQNGETGKGHFLCQLGSIQAAPFAPYPWVNEPYMLELGFDDEGIHGEDNCAVFSDMGSIYLFMDEDGIVTSTHECY